MSFDSNWKAISTSNKKFVALIVVDGEEISDFTYASSLNQAKLYFMNAWTLPLYESESFELINVKEEKQQ